MHVEGGQAGMYGIEERARLGVDEMVLVGWRRGIRRWRGAAVVGILRERRESAGSRQFAGSIAGGGKWVVGVIWWGDVGYKSSRVGTAFRDGPDRRSEIRSLLRASCHSRLWR